MPEVTYFEGPDKNPSKLGCSNSTNRLKNNSAIVCYLLPFKSYRINFKNAFSITNKYILYIFSQIPQVL